MSIPADWVSIINGIGTVTVVGSFLYIGRKLQCLDDLADTTKKVKLNLKVISDFLIRNHTKFDPKELQAFSPLRLTDIGAKLVKDLAFDTVFKEHKETFYRKIDEVNPKFKYDVENAAIRSITELYDQDYVSCLKVFLYNNPHRTLQDTAPTLGIFIRDQYLQDHPEIVE